MIRVPSETAIHVPCKIGGIFIQEGNELRSFTIAVRKITTIRHLVPQAPLVRNPLVRRENSVEERLECLLQSCVRNEKYDTVSTISKLKIKEHT